MQRVVLGVLVASAAAAAVWLAWGPGEEEGGAVRAPEAEAPGDPHEPLSRDPALVFASRRPAADDGARELEAGLGDDEGRASAPEPEAGDPGSRGEQDGRMTGSAGGAPGRSGGSEGGPGTEASGRPSAPIPPSPLADVPFDAPSDLPSDVFDDPGDPIDPARLDDLESQVARLAEKEQLVDPRILDERAQSQVDPKSPVPADQQYQEARTKILADAKILDHLTTQQYGSDLPPTQKAHVFAVGEKILSLQNDTYRGHQMEIIIQRQDAGE